MFSFRGMALLVAALVAFSLLLLPLVEALELFVVHNPRSVHPLHLLFVWALGGVLLWALLPVMSWPLFLAIGSMIGGASSNLLYRIVFGPVPDYIPFPLGAYGNAADLFIFTGSLLFLAWVFWQMIARYRYRKVTSQP